ncbi:MAG: 50S ribosomal protein L23 [Gemmatimonadales bacterium]|nr:50S ribosomal protein L23 [Gemmatimonadales bacterium]NIN12765.1 50S ribosomal protein L23 [Gemmatimonadales bacterium]NIN50989.1 50S ribosomal protein L23 [Gemmatimonadales bacterium]NIP08453.1 50S ribosomal protein L23 [Gemmatimonadales bacterium]NIR02173.1 50S ribosomal protein L23 [Gemmatimonadales bacterium]
MPDLYRAVVRPVVTEKSSAKYGALKEYTFEVDRRATKPEIREAVERLFGVRVTHVRTVQQRSKRRTRGRSEGRRSRWKKAFVRLKEGDSIEIFEG